MNGAVLSSHKAYDAAESKKKKKAAVQPKLLIKKATTWLLFSLFTKSLFSHLEIQDRKLISLHFTCL